MIPLPAQLAILFIAGAVSGFINILAGLMIAMLVLIIFDPSKRLRENRRPITGMRRVGFALGFFGVGLFGGFIQAGAGFLIIALMLLAGFDLVATNAVTVLVTMIFTIAALAVFILRGEMNYLRGLGLGAGSAVGGWLATRFAVKKGHAWIRAFVIIMVVIFAAKLLIDSLFSK